MKRDGNRAVEHLAAMRASIDIPDYSSTLRQMNPRLAASAQALAEIAGKPVMQLTPEALASRMDTAAEKSRSTDRMTLREARRGMGEAPRTIRGLVGIMHGVRERRRHLVWSAGGGLLVGGILWSILPGAVVRAFPANWHLPEGTAAYAGARMKAGNPVAWWAVTNATQIRRDNLDAIETCARVAATTKQPTRCVIRIEG